MRDTNNRSNALKRIASFVAVLVVLYPLSAVIVSVLVRRGIIPTGSSAFSVVARFYDPFFSVIYYIPGADDTFARVTCWLAGVQP